MKTNAILALAAVAVFCMMVGGARADFYLTGTEHLMVSSPEGQGTLEDASSVDIVTGGSAVYVHSTGASTVNLSGGTIAGGNGIFAEGSSAVTVSAGSVNRISVHQARRRTFAEERWDTFPSTTRAR